MHVGHDADVGAVRRRFAGLAAEQRLDEGKAALIATELGTNIVKHAREGGAIVGAARGRIQIVAWDRGPGMNVAACLRDGMSTAGTAGNGLGAIARLATGWDAYAQPGHGTVIAAWLGEAPRGRVAHGVVSLPAHPGDPCGDAFELHVEGDRATALGIDGLGHGAGAAEAAAAVLSAFRVRPGDAPMRILERGHAAARSTRGAAATCVHLDLGARRAHIAGVGNVAAVIVADRHKQLVTQHGTLGQVTPALREESYPFPPGALLVIASDGLKSRWTLDEYPGLTAREPLVVAAVLWRDLTRGRDDATVAVVREVG